jgi:hypothetical protein
MAQSKIIPKLDDSSYFEEKCDKLRLYLLSEPSAPLPYINSDFVTPLQDFQVPLM